MNIPINLLVEMIFKNPPQRPSSIKISNGDDKNMLPVLMNILILGSKKLFGDSIQPAHITNAQLNILQEYFNSMGYIIKYNYTFSPEGIPIRINIWFEHFNSITKCNGTTVFL